MNLFDTMPCPHCSGTGQILAHAVTSRTSDPDTSHTAGQRHVEDLRVIRHGTKRHAVLDTFRSVGAMTAQAVALHIHRGDDAIGNIEGTRRRVSDLARAGFIRDTGQRRENPGSGTKAIVWTITPTGLEALQRSQNV